LGRRRVGDHHQRHEPLYDAFLNDDIFADPQTREAMFHWMDWECDTLDYGLGIMRIEGKTLSVWGHLGVGNAMMFYWPDGDVILTGTLNQQDINSGVLISQILKAVESFQKKSMISKQRISTMTKKQKSKKKIFWTIGGLITLVAITILVLIKSLIPKENDYSELSWTDAYDQMHAQISKKYPFTDWKDIDWDELYSQTAPRIAQAESENDPAAYYLAFRELVYAIPDGHVHLGGPDLGLREAAIGGGYGFGVIGLDGEQVIAHILLEDGPAAQAGMAWGAEILTWDDQPIQEALVQTDIIWANAPQATKEGRRMEQYHFLTRAPVGTKITISFHNPDEDAPQTVQLTAIADEFETLNRDLPHEKGANEIFQAPVQYEILPGGVGYISISGFMPTLGGLTPGRIFDKAIESFIGAEVSGIVIDVRANGGGLDALVPKMVGHFYDEPGFYEYVSVYDPENGDFTIDPKQTLTIEPRAPYFGGPVIVLVDKYSVSTAEGVPLAIQPLPQGYVVGIHGTNGSFAVGMPGRNLYHLPERLIISFLGDRALDEEQIIQIDGDAEGIGGISPDIRVPLTEENIQAMYVDGVDIVLETAIATIAEIK
jgi:carboxyl-terminal processing protease